MRADWTITHDFAFTLGGAERVTAALAELLPDAPVEIFAGHVEVMEQMGIDRRSSTIEASWVRESNYRALVLAHAIIGRRQYIEGNVLASSYGFAHLVRSGGRKVIYFHSPLRQAWSGVDSYSTSMGPIVGSAWRGFAAPLYRRIDRSAVAESDRLIATSREVRERIRNFYGRDAEIIPPPVAPIFRPSPMHASKRGEHYLWVGRIVEPYKKLALLIEAFRGSSRQLYIVGDGRDRPALEAAAPPNVSFLGSRRGEELANQYGGARALLLPSADDFGMVATEAMACGTPVIAWDRGGARDTVEDGLSGLLYADATVRGIRDALIRFEKTEWQRERIVEWANQFALERFHQSIRATLSDS